MGQYFTYVNEDRNERLHPPGGMKAAERLLDHDAVAMASYLLLQGPMDGTVLYHALDDDSEVVNEQFNNVQQRETEYEAKHDRRSTYRNDDGTWDTDGLTRVAKAYCEIDDLEYAGRWAGDRVTLVGDYDESGLFDSGYEDITERVMQEMEQHPMFKGHFRFVEQAPEPQVNGTR